MHDSFTPLGGVVPLLLMQLGEVVFGGVGSGLYGMLVFAIMAVFIAGLMIGRTPEYLGKKIEAYEMKMVSIAILVTPLLVLVGTAVAVLAEAGKAGIANPGAHGFSEILYAFTSAANNNGSAFAGPVGQHAVLQRAARRGDVVRPLRRDRAGAGDRRLAGGQEAHAGRPPARCRRTARCSSALLIGTVLLVGLLTYVPALALGPGGRAPDAVVRETEAGHDHDNARHLPLFDPALVKPAAASMPSRKLDPRVQWRNPVMFVVYVGSILTTVAAGCRPWSAQGEAPAGFILADRAVAVVHGAVRQLRRGAGRGPQQGAGGVAARHEAQTSSAKKLRAAAPRLAVAPSPAPTNCARATSCWSRPATSSRSTAR